MLKNDPVNLLKHKFLGDCDSVGLTGTEDWWFYQVLR